MTFVQFHGWQMDFDKVAQNRLFRKHAAMGLREAKEAVDRIVSGEPVVISLQSGSDAAKLIKESTAVGARCSIISESVAIPFGATEN